MGSNLMAIFHTVLCKCWVPLHGFGYGVNSDPPPELFEQPHDPPASNARTIFKIVLGVEVPRTYLDAARSTLLPQVRLSAFIAIFDIALTTFLVVQDKRDGNSSSIWPLGIVQRFPKTYMRS